MVVTFPKHFNRQTMYELINQVIDQNISPKSNEFIFDFTTLSFIEPVGVTVLSNLIEWLSKREIKVVFTTPQKAIVNAAAKYLDDSEFFLRYLGQNQYLLSSPRSTTIPLKLVSYKESYQWLETELITWLSWKLSLTPASLADIKVCVQEIFNNINDHSQEQIGCVFVQHYPKINKIRLAISDFGVGVPNVVKSLHPYLTDSQALEKAIEQGFSTKSTPQNTGAGLDILIQIVTQKNGGCVYIHSNNGILNCNNIRNERQDICGFYPGTLFEIDLRTDSIENIIDAEEEFAW